MIWDLEAGWLFMAVAVVAMLGYILGYVLDQIMQQDGFGPFGNMMVISGGFFVGLFAYNSYGYRIQDLREAAVVGLTGAFIALASLAIGRSVFTRL